MITIIMFCFYYVLILILIHTVNYGWDLYKNCLFLIEINSNSDTSDKTVFDQSKLHWGKKIRLRYLKKKNFWKVINLNHSCLYVLFNFGYFLLILFFMPFFLNYCQAFEFLVNKNCHSSIWKWSWSITHWNSSFPSVNYMKKINQQVYESCGCFFLSNFTNSIETIVVFLIKLLWTLYDNFTMSQFIVWYQHHQAHKIKEYANKEFSDK